MKIIPLTISLFFVVITLLNTTNLLGQNNYISIIIPEEKETTTTLKRYRLAGNTLPNSSVEINGKKIRVYSSGAFVDLMNLEIGENEFEIESTNKGKKVLEKFVIIRKDNELMTTPDDSLALEDDMMLPARDQWLDIGDILEVRVKGTPDAEVSFMEGIKMTELPVSQTNGIEGVYTGIFKIKNPMDIEKMPILFTLQKDGEVITKESKAKISIIPNSLPRVAVVKGDLPYLNYGLGEDRLGGAKLSYLEPGIKLAIDGKVGDQYRVRLTKNMVAWIPEKQVELLPAGTFIPKSLTESWAVYGGRKTESVIIRLNEKLPFSTRQEVNPTRIIVDIYGATCNSNWITQHLTAKEVKNLRYEQVEEDLFRVIIEPVHKQIWGYDIGYKGNALHIKIKKQPEILSFSNLKFVLDAGHGGSNKGALGATGIKEKEVTLDIVNRLASALEKKGATVIKTRTDDSFSFNSDRLKKIKSADADILISIHANSIGLSSDPKKVMGTSTYYKHICYRSLSLAIYKRMLELDLKPFGNIGNFNFTLNAPTQIANVLVETAFLSNPNDEIKLMNGIFKEKMVMKIIEGVKDWLYDCEDNMN